MKRWILAALITVLSVSCFGCKADEEIKPGPTPKPATPEVIVNNAQVPPEHIIQVGGYGEVIASPDYATITLGVSGTAETAEQASARCQENLDGVYAAADTLGVSKSDISDAGITITAHQRETDGAITGYAGTAQIVIIANDVKTANSIMSSIIDAAVCELKSVTYSLTDATTAYQSALVAAMSDAHQKAQALAEAGTVTLGAVIGVVETPIDDSTLVGVDFDTSAIAVPAKITVQYLIK